jgi:hypothetical protein
MFKLDTDGSTILMHRGNTGTVRITLDGYTFGNNDRVLFRMRSSNGTIVKDKICEVVDGAIEIEFVNTDTDYLSPGYYYYGVTAATDPVYDDEGNIVNGTGVDTPEELNEKIIRIYETTALI